MRRLLNGVMFSLAAALGVSAGTAPIYINTSGVSSPPAVAPVIDASIFVNQAGFSIDQGSAGGTLPFQTLNTLIFTNTAAGIMSGSPGFRFDFFTNNFRLKMSNWVNRGSISSEKWLLVASTNITSSGPLNTGPAGLIRLDGNNVSIIRDGIRSGSSPLFFAGGFNGVSNYLDPAGVIDLYWGAGSNNRLDTMGTPMPLFQGNLAPPFPQSPFHQVEEVFSGFVFTNTVSVPGASFIVGTNFFFGNAFLPYGAFVFTNTVSPTSSVIQVVFIPTNNFDTNFSADVRFVDPSLFRLGPPLFGPAAAIVELKATDFDIVTQTYNTNAVYLIDTSAVGTNIFLSQNFLANTRRPNTYEIARDTPFGFAFGTNGNTPFTNTLIYNTTYQSNFVPVLYAGYGAQISSLGASSSSSLLSDPTNFAGRVEIISGSLNMDKARIRAESTVIIKSKDLSSNKVAQVDAPFCNYDLTSLQPDLVISNLAPVSVRRLSGQIAAWSAIWNNVQITGNQTNLIQFHVLIVENDLTSLKPVLVNELALHGANIVIYDELSVGKSILLEGNSVNIVGALTFPGAASWAATNVLNVLNFTNSGVLIVGGAEIQGADRAIPYNNYVNTGTNIASAHLIDALNFQNSGCLIANGGVLSITADTASLVAPPRVVVTNVFTNVFVFQGTQFSNVFTNITAISSGAKLQAAADIEISANSLFLSNSVITAGGISPGTLVLSVTNQLLDFGQAGINDWELSAGLQILTLPQTSDLLGTHIRFNAAPNSEVLQVWPAGNFGPNASGFSNNLAVGKVTLDGGDSGQFRFTGTTANRALYVDYLELVGNATNFNSALAIEPSIFVYFANANITPSKLDGTHLDENGTPHLIWAPAFAGPLSSTNIFYASTGKTYTFNIALVLNKDLDSDGDGISNFDDPEPIPVPESLGLTLGLSKAQPPRALLSWNAFFNCDNYLECKPGLNSTNWVLVTNFNTGPANMRVTVPDILSTNKLRVYRVRMELPKR